MAGMFFSKKTLTSSMTQTPLQKDPEAAGAELKSGKGISRVTEVS